jgi:predicted ATP-grasp superfamily ATP-dependent carboligase
MEHNIVENGNTFITVTSTQTTSVSYTIRNFTIAQGVNNATTENQRKTISHNTTNDTFRTIYQNASSQTVNV